jgi:hypothetical protein
MAASDTHYGSVTALYPFTANVTSVAPLALTQTLNGTTLSTTQYKFATGSRQTDGVSDVLRITTTAALPQGTEDFTVEGWTRITSWANTVNTLANLYTSSTNGWRLAILSNGRPRLELHNTYESLLHSATLSLNTWFHWAVTRTAAGLRAWINGVPSDPIPTALSFAPTSLIFWAPGWGNTLDEIAGQHNEYRVTRGVCRYTAAFTPATEPWPQQYTEITGTVTDDAGDGVARTLRLHERTAGTLVTSTTSAAVTGAYTLPVFAAGSYQLICLDDVAGAVLDDLLHRVTIA